MIRVHAAGITPTELEWSETWVDRQGHDRTPTIPSHEVSGVVEELGPGVTHVVAGEEVYGLVPFDQDGAAADYVAVRARDLAPKPVTLDHSRTAALPLSALTAWQAFTEQAHVQPGNHVLVHGGAGGVGAFAVQIAKALGARVTATASAGDIEYVRSLGADVVIDYTAKDFGILDMARRSAKSGGDGIPRILQAATCSTSDRLASSVRGRSTRPPASLGFVRFRRERTGRVHGLESRSAMGHDPTKLAARRR